MLKTCLYARVSTDSEEQQQALQQQLQRLRQAAPGAEEFIDRISGTKDSRPALDQLMQAVDRGEVAAIYATRLDRLTRSRRQGAELIDLFMQPDAPRLVLLDDNLDLSTSSGRFIGSMLVAWATSESERLGERTRHGHAYRRSKLLPFGPKPPFGYQFNADRTNLEVDPINGPIARELVELYIKRRGGLRYLVKHAKERHGLTFGGQASIKRWLLNPALMGARCYGITEKVTIKDATGRSKVVRRHKPPGQFSEVHPECHPPLITELQFAQVCAIATLPKDRTTEPVRPGRTRTLSGLSVCMHCGRKLHTHQSGTKRWYRCGNSACVQVYRNRVPETELYDAIYARMTGLAESITARAETAYRLSEIKESDHLNDLRIQLEQLQAMRSDFVADAIVKLQAAIRAEESKAVLSSDAKPLDIEAMRRFFGSREGWERLREELPAELREVLLSWKVLAGVEDCQIRFVMVAGDTITDDGVLVYQN